MRQLGKKPAVLDHRLAAMHHVVPPDIVIPDSANWYAAVGDWPMLGNDRMGNCVEVAALHEIQRRYAYVGKSMPFVDEDAENLYMEWAGYHPDNPSTDGGTIMRDAMQRWATDGIVVSDAPDDVDKLTSFVAVSLAAERWLQLAIHMCGAVLAGFYCPASWTQEGVYLFHGADVRDSPIVGGHCMLLVGYEATALGAEYDVVTWGGRGRMIQPLEAMDEAYAILDRDDLDVRGLNPAGVDWAALEAAMAVVRSA